MASSFQRLYVPAVILSQLEENSHLCCGLPLETEQPALPQLLCFCNECSISRLHLWSVVSGVVFFFNYFLAFLRMHTARSPSSIPTGVSGDALELSLSGSQLSISKRPSSASPGKCFSRSVSVSVASESRGKRNTLVRTPTKSRHPR